MKRLLLTLLCFTFLTSVSLPTEADTQEAHPSDTHNEPSLSDIQISATTIAAFQRIELRATNSFHVDNPDDPRQIDVEAIFTAPSGKPWHMPGFLYHDLKRTEKGLEPNGELQWCARFTPTEPGSWTAYLQVTFTGKTHQSPKVPFQVTETEGRGFLRRAEANPLALEFQNGDHFFAIGSNVFPSTRLGQPIADDRAAQVIQYLKKTAAAGGTFCRLRMDSWWLPIEATADPVTGYQGPGRYHPQACWEIDRIVEAAEHLGITLIFCISNSNSNVDARDKRRGQYNFYLKENGGPLESNEQFWTDPEVRHLFQQKIRYCVARWGASPAVGMWEFFNEVELPRDKAETIIQWHRSLARDWRALDPYERPITTSPGFSAAEQRYQLFATPEMDVFQYHTYDFNDLAEGMARCNSRIITRVPKPLLVGEFGSPEMLHVHLRQGDLRLDLQGIHLHNGIWAATMSGSVGALPWFIRGYIDPSDLYHVYTGLSRFCTDWKINQKPWLPIKATAIADKEALETSRWGRLDLPVLRKFERPQADLYTLGHDGSLGTDADVNGYLWGTGGHRDLRRPPTFDVEFPADGRFIVTVHAVIGRPGTQTPVTVELDGRQIAQRVFDVGPGKGKDSFETPSGNYNVKYDEQIVIPISAGQHHIRVSAEGTDRAEVSYTLDPYADPTRTLYRVLAMGCNDEIRLWLQHAQHTDARRAEGHLPTSAPPATIHIPKMQPGRYEVEWWDTVTGKPICKETVTSRDGTLTIPHPGTLTDEAAKIRRLP